MVGSVYAMASAGIITRQSRRYSAQFYDLNEIEARSLSSLPLRGGGHPYWLTVQEVGAYLRVDDSRVKVLLDQEKIPSVMAPNGRRYVRRHQLEVVTNARDQRAAAFG